MIPVGAVGGGCTRLLRAKDIACEGGRVWICAFGSARTGDRRRNAVRGASVPRFLKVVEKVKLVLAARVLQNEIQLLCLAPAVVFAIDIKRVNV